MPKKLEREIAAGIRRAHPGMTPREAKSAAIATMISRGLWKVRSAGEHSVRRMHHHHHHLTHHRRHHHRGGGLVGLLGIHQITHHLRAAAGVGVGRARHHHRHRHHRIHRRYR